MDRSRTRLLTEMALTVAIAATLNRFAVFQMPFGGSVSLDMLPLVVFGLRNGVGPALVAGAAFGFVDYLMEPFFVHWAQVLLDYPVAFAVIGLGGVMRSIRPDRSGAASGGRHAWTVIAAGAIGVAARFAAHFASGVIFFGENAPPGQPVWVYSGIYNATYLLPSGIVCVAAAAVLVPALERVVPSKGSNRGRVGVGDRSARGA